MNKLNDCIIIDIPKEDSDRGSLSYIESNNQIPFEIKRVYFTYDIPCGAQRGGHAHIEQHEIIVAISGSFDVVIDDGDEKDTKFLNNPSKGLWVKPGIWRELKNFSSGSVILVLSSGLFDENDYIRDYSAFIKNHL